jgi:hypothetical protein
MRGSGGFRAAVVVFSHRHCRAGHGVTGGEVQPRKFAGHGMPCAYKPLIVF